MLDADICVDILAGVGDVLRQRIEMALPGTLVTSAVALAEVMGSAVRRGGLIETRRLFGAIPVLPFDRPAAEAYATTLSNRGCPGRLIAAHALALDLTLVTGRERDFADVPRLRVENWMLPL